MTAPASIADARIVELDRQPTIAVRLEIPLPELAAAFDRWIPQIVAKTSSIGASIAGAPFARYHRFGPDGTDVEIGFPVSTVPADLRSLAAEPLGPVAASALPGGTVATGVHIGPYDGLNGAYDALHAWIHAQPGVDDGDGPWEVYVTDPSAVSDPADLRTEIFWPLRRTRSLAGALRRGRDRSR